MQFQLLTPIHFTLHLSITYEDRSLSFPQKQSLALYIHVEEAYSSNCINSMVSFRSELLLFYSKFMSDKIVHIRVQFAFSSWALPCQDPMLNLRDQGTGIKGNGNGMSWGRRDGRERKKR